MKTQLHILSKPIHSGKTTELYKWAENSTDVAGVLTPDLNGVRMIYDLAAKKHFPFEIPQNTTVSNIQAIGRFTFYQSAFDLVHIIIEEAFLKDSNWLIIDEVGPLELQEKGFHPILKQIIPAYLGGIKKGNLVLVIRENLLKQVRDFYEIKGYEEFDWKL